MPELPDVEVFRERLAKGALNREIAEVDLRDPERLRGARTDDLGAALTGYWFESVHRHGKVLFLKVSCGWQFVMHFGMTGAVYLYDNPTAAPAYARLVLRYADGGYFAFDNMRKLGWVELTDDVGIYLRSQDIGPDVLNIDRESFAARLHAKHGALKSALMDQATLAGLGNIYSDEVLFHAGLRPDHTPADLPRDALDRIYDAAQRVLPAAADCGARPESLPADWLVPHREEGGSCPACGRPLTVAEISGRKAYFCQTCQG